MLGLRIILIGPPGVGKGTQAALLEQRLGIRPLSSGLIFRQEIDAETDLGRLAKRYIDHGRLVPNGITIEMMSKRLHSEYVRAHGFVLDGFPRTIEQAEALDEEMEDMGLHLDRVVSIELDEDTIVKRLSGRLGCTKCGEIYHKSNKPPKRAGLCDHCNSPLFVRADDDPDTIRERLRIFNDQTAPVIDYYEQKGLLLRVTSEDDPDATYNAIMEGLAAGDPA